LIEPDEVEELDDDDDDEGEDEGEALLDEDDISTDASDDGSEWGGVDDSVPNPPQASATPGVDHPAPDAGSFVAYPGRTSSLTPAIQQHPPSGTSRQGSAPAPQPKLREAERQTQRRS
jgi:hypothetical protein